MPRYGARERVAQLVNGPRVRSARLVHGEHAGGKPPLEDHKHHGKAEMKFSRRIWSAGESGGVVLSGGSGALLLSHYLKKEVPGHFLSH